MNLKKIVGGLQVVMLLGAIAIALVSLSSTPVRATSEFVPDPSVCSGSGNSCVAVDPQGVEHWFKDQSGSMQ